MLVVPTGQLGDPVSVVVGVKTGDGLTHSIDFFFVPLIHGWLGIVREKSVRPTLDLERFLTTDQRTSATGTVSMNPIIISSKL
ncbi:hypothetical protein K227x_32140 [Rubripirellula lacrimiformis]|uniref:Uncharacterized protein n=1 Tax=Rubripirellula lacrimiformis TaxID=1930273 RepID=A0A517NCE8_9BACT|nr:hypothetical protein K227x_32140 [Rubripirellula lacrimiformis]